MGDVGLDHFLFCSAEFLRGRRTYNSEPSGLTKGYVWVKLGLFLRREGQSEEEIASSSHCVKRPRLAPTLAKVLGRQPPPPRPESPRDPPLAPRSEMLVWCLFAPPQGFGDFRVPVLGEKDLKAHLDLSPEAGSVAEVRSLSQQNPGCDRDFVCCALATSSSPTSRRTSPKLQQRSWRPSPVCVWLCRCPLQSP